MTDNFDDVNKSTLSRYNKRLSQYGLSPKSLGWLNVETQYIRFDNVIRAIDEYLDHKAVIMDLGCGFGDFGLYLLNSEINFSNYIGIDINKNLIKHAKGRGLPSNFEFLNGDILDDSFREKIISYKPNIIVANGVLNFNLGNSKRNLEYTSSLMASSWEITSNVVCFDFISAINNINYPKEKSIFYHHPHDVINIVSELSPHFLIKHNYVSLPQREFLVVASKKPY
jgi:SAM-dependent methyltransferase